MNKIYQNNDLKNDFNKQLIEGTIDMDVVNDILEKVQAIDINKYL